MKNTISISELAKKFIEGEWLYSTSEKILKKKFSTDKELLELNLIDQEGYLDEILKTAIEEALGSEIISSVQGPFGDEDIFSGDILENVTEYNIELHQISEKTMDALQKISNVHIKIIS